MYQFEILYFLAHKLWNCLQPQKFHYEISWMVNYQALVSNFIAQSYEICQAKQKLVILMNFVRKFHQIRHGRTNSMFGVYKCMDVIFWLVLCSWNLIFLKMSLETFPTLCFTTHRSMLIVCETYSLACHTMSYHEGNIKICEHDDLIEDRPKSICSQKQPHGCDLFIVLHGFTYVINHNITFANVVS